MKNPRFKNFYAFRDTMLADGWKTSDTYDNHFSSTPLAPGVYLMAVLDLDPNFTDIPYPLAAYVGKSLKLSQRLIGHEVYSLIYDQAGSDCTFSVGFFYAQMTKLMQWKSPLDVAEVLDHALNSSGNLQIFFA